MAPPATMVGRRPFFRRSRSQTPPPDPMYTLNNTRRRSSSSSDWNSSRRNSKTSILCGGGGGGGNNNKKTGLDKRGDTKTPPLDDSTKVRGFFGVRRRKGRRKSRLLLDKDDSQAEESLSSQQSESLQSSQRSGNRIRRQRVPSPFSGSNSSNNNNRRTDSIDDSDMKETIDVVRTSMTTPRQIRAQLQRQQQQEQQQQQQQQQQRQQQQNAECSLKLVESSSTTRSSFSSANAATVTNIRQSPEPEEDAATTAAPATNDETNIVLFPHPPLPPRPQDKDAKRPRRHEEEDNDYISTSSPAIPFTLSQQRRDQDARKGVSQDTATPAEAVSSAGASQSDLVNGEEGEKGEQQTQEEEEGIEDEKTTTTATATTTSVLPTPSQVEESIVRRSVWKRKATSESSFQRLPKRMKNQKSRPPAASPAATSILVQSFLISDPGHVPQNVPPSTSALQRLPKRPKKDRKKEMVKQSTEQEKTMAVPVESKKPPVVLGRPSPRKKKPVIDDKDVVPELIEEQTEMQTGVNEENNNNNEDKASVSRRAIAFFSSLRRSGPPTLEEKKDDTTSTRVSSPPPPSAFQSMSNRIEPDESRRPATQPLATQPETVSRSTATVAALSSQPSSKPTLRKRQRAAAAALESPRKPAIADTDVTSRTRGALMSSDSPTFMVESPSPEKVVASIQVSLKSMDTPSPLASPPTQSVDVDTNKVSASEAVENDQVMETGPETKVWVPFPSRTTTITTVSGQSALFDKKSFAGDGMEGTKVWLPFPTTVPESPVKKKKGLSGPIARAVRRTSKSSPQRLEVSPSQRSFSSRISESPSESQESPLRKQFVLEQSKGVSQVKPPPPPSPPVATKLSTSAAIEAMRARLKAERDRKQSRRKLLGASDNSSSRNRNNDNKPLKIDELSNSRRSQSEPPMQRTASIRLHEKREALQKRGNYVNYRIESATLKIASSRSLDAEVSLEESNAENNDDNDDDDDDEHQEESEYASEYDTGLSYEQWEQMGFAATMNRKRRPSSSQRKVSSLLTKF